MPRSGSVVSSRREKEQVVGTVVRDGTAIARDVDATLRMDGRIRRASFVAPAGAIRADDVLHFVTPGDAPRVLALHVDRPIRKRADVDGDPIDARVLADMT
jgi:hypothetical protein